MKRMLSFFLVPLTKWYLRKKRSYNKHGVNITVEPGVFHPGLFFSSNYLWGHLKELGLSGKSLLEFGCGSGMICVLAAKQGARVTALDISELALSNTKINADTNQVNINCVQSDLFDHLEPFQYDIIAINPPYYKGQVGKTEEHAWYAGKAYEYFDRLFRGLGNFMNESSEVVMVLSDGCDIALIRSKASNNGFKMELIDERKFWLEVNYLFRISR